MVDSDLASLIVGIVFVLIDSVIDEPRWTELRSDFCVRIVSSSPESGGNSALGGYFVISIPATDNVDFEYSTVTPELVKLVDFILDLYFSDMVDSDLASLIVGIVLVLIDSVTGEPRWTEL